MYCGTNALDRDIVNGTKRLGTRYSCLKRGIGRGYHLPADDKYLGEYEPLDNTRKYCGNANALPEGYDRFGTIHECHTMGIGAGRKIKANEEFRGIRPPNDVVRAANQSVLYFHLILSIVAIIVAIVCLVVRINEWKKLNEPVDWFVIVLFILTILTSLGLLYIVWTKFRNT